MWKQIKELCLFMICGQTLLYFQSGKKYEKICRMILELLVLAGIVGMILNFLQSIGIQKGERQALGGAVASMQQSMEEALERQLDTDNIGRDPSSGFLMESLVEKYTMEEIKSKYNYFAEQYGFEIEKAEQTNDGLRVYIKAKAEQETVMETDDIASEEVQEEESRENAEEGDMTGNTAEIAKIQQIEIEKIELEDGRKKEEETDEEKDKASGNIQEDKLETFRRQLALVFAMEEEKLEVILID